MYAGRIPAALITPDPRGRLPKCMYLSLRFGFFLRKKLIWRGFWNLAGSVSRIAKSPSTTVTGTVIDLLWQFVSPQRHCSSPQ